MGTTIPNTFTANQNIDAGKIQQNTQDIQGWLNGNLAAADIDPAAIQREHLVAPQYTGTNNTFEFITGLYGGKTYSTSQARLTGICSEPTDKQSVSIPTYQWVANGGISFYLEDKAKVLFTIGMSPITTANKSQDVGKARFFITLDGTPIGSTRFTTGAENPSPSRERNYCSNFYATDNYLNAGYHTIGIKGFTNEDYTLFTAWTLTLEAYYENDNQPEGEG